MPWTDAQLARLPVRHGFRLRGLEMTRLETFCDAAFAFAVTLLVIAGDGIPASYDELVRALKGIPAFAASFVAIAGIWWAHRLWSRRFGLDDGVTTVISLAMVLVMLIYVYPLKMMFSAFAHWASGGFFPGEFTLARGADLLGLFVIYGLGFAAQMGLLALLHARALRVADDLRLDAVERLRTRQEVIMNLVLAGTGVVSALFAWLMPPGVAVWAGFVYMTLPITMPLLAVRYARKVDAIAAGVGQDAAAAPSAGRGASGP